MLGTDECKEAEEERIPEGVAPDEQEGGDCSKKDECEEATDKEDDLTEAEEQAKVALMIFHAMATLQSLGDHPMGADERKKVFEKIETIAGEMAKSLIASLNKENA